MEKIVCDICGKNAVPNEKYSVPMNFVHTERIDEYVVDKYEKVEFVEVDLCKECKKKIADAIETIAKK